MRLTSAMWFAVFMRNETARGAYVSVAKKGAQQAGAIFVVQMLRDGRMNLFGPAPQALVSDPLEDDRSFELVVEASDSATVTAYLEKQQRFDPDLWVLETESGEGDIALKLAKAL